MKNTRYCAGPAYYRMCSTDVYCSKQTGSSSTKAKPSPIISSFRNWAEETVDVAKNLWAAQKIQAKTETQQTFVKWIARFYYQ